MLPWILSPLLIPTYVTLLLFTPDFHYSTFSWPAKRFLVLVMFISTAVLPSITLVISEFGKSLGFSTLKPGDNRVAMLFVGMYYYLGYFLLNKMPVYAILKILVLAGAILIVIMTLLSVWQFVSWHMAAAGGAFGVLLALSMRIGLNPVLVLMAVILVSGLLGTALMIRDELRLQTILTGYLTGFAVIFLIFYLL